MLRSRQIILVPGSFPVEFYRMATARVVLITGCSSGIGLSTAVLLAKDPEKRFKVYATMRNPAKKDKLEEAGKANLGDTLFVKQLDVCSDEGVTQLVQELTDREGRIDILINNAGVSVSSIMECIPLEVSKEVFDINVYGVLRTMNAVMPGMKARQGGHIVNIGSVFGILGAPNNEIYCATKFAVEGLTESIAPMLKKFNVKCSLIQPGPVATSLGENSQLMSKRVDTSLADSKSKELLESGMKRFLIDVRPHTIQTCDEVAQLIKDVLLTDKPHLQYLTSNKFMIDMAKEKFSDLSGDSTIESIEKWWFPDI